MFNVQTKNKKYQLLETGITTTDGIKLYRIKANRDFDDVKQGDLGGFVESESNLAQYDNSWIYGDMIVIGDARVQNNAKIRTKNTDDNTISENMVIGDCDITDSTIKSKNVHTENSTIDSVTAGKDYENIVIKNSKLSGVTFDGSNIKIINSKITGKVTIGNNVKLSGTIIDAGNLTIKDRIVITDTKIVYNPKDDNEYTATIQNDSNIANSIISITDFYNVVFDSIDFDNVKIGCGVNSKLSTATIRGRTYDSLIGFNGESENIEIAFDGTTNNVCISNSKNLHILNHSNNNLYVCAENTTLDENCICEGIIKLGCNNIVILSELNEIGTKNLSGEYKQPDFSDLDTEDYKVTNLTINGNSLLNSCMITKSENCTIGLYSHIYDGTHIEELKNSYIYAKVNGTITKSDNIYIENNAYIESMTKVKNVHICGNTTVTSLKEGNYQNLVINGNSYINAENITGGIINSSEVTNTDGEIINCIINNSEVTDITAEDKIINNSVIDGEVKYNEYDNRQNN